LLLLFKAQTPVQAAPAFLLVMPIPAKITRSYLSRAGACLILTACVPSLVTSGDAHDWYPEECCRAKDCAPVESWAFAHAVQRGSLPQLSVITKHGTAIVPQNLPRREIKRQPHARMYAGLGQCEADRLHLSSSRDLNSLTPGRWIRDDPYQLGSERCYRASAAGPSETGQDLGRRKFQSRARMYGPAVRGRLSVRTLATFLERPPGAQAGRTPHPLHFKRRLTMSYDALGPLVRSTGSLQLPFHCARRGQMEAQK
jgi:hypothetical protein